MSDTVKTVTIARPDLPGGVLVINETDYSPDTMTLAGAEPKPVVTKGKPRGSNR